MSKTPVDGYSLLSSPEDSNPTPLAALGLSFYSQPSFILINRGRGERSYSWTPRRERLVTEAWQRSRAGKWVVKERKTDRMYTCRDTTDKDGVVQ